jgi:hypothetical protein
MPAAREAVAGHGHLAGAYAAVDTTALDPVLVRDEKFAYGLDVVLDGLALRIGR